MSKKSERYLAKKAEKRKAVQSARKQSPSPSERSPAKRPRWIRVIEWVGGSLIFGAVAFVSFVYTLAGGPPWPVTPSFSPGFPSASFALDVPFAIKNKSAFFSLKHMQIICGLQDVQTSANIVFAHTSVSTSNGEAILEPLQSATYTCPFSRKLKLPEGARVTSATIVFIAKYDSPWPFGKSEESTSEPFYLDMQTSTKSQQL